MVNALKWFKKKEKTVNEEPPKCKHKWKDFPWYTTLAYSDTRKWATIKIIEPYVCIFCKERKDVDLYETSFKVDSWEEARESVNNLTKRYSEHFEERAIIEDQINDMQLVDREYIKAYELLKNGPLFK